MVQQRQIKQFKRFPSRVEGLDRILNGGFLQGGIYLVMGPPGSGKTILANQIAFEHVGSGGRVVYVSLLSEGHGRLFGHLSSMEFFDENCIQSRIHYISAYQTLEKDGFESLLKLIAQTVRKFEATFLIIDGVATAEDLARERVTFKKFVHDLSTVLSTSNCTSFLLSSFEANMQHPEHTMVDGIVSLSYHQEGMRTIRQLEVKKIRGSAHLGGLHFFDISDQGVKIYPRIESHMGRRTLEPFENTEILKSGVPKLDQLLGGGIVAGSVTALIGAAGTGKTLLGTQFLAAGASSGQAGLYFGFYEVPERLIRKSEKVGIEVRSHFDSGRIHAIWNPPLEHIGDELADLLLTAVRERGIKRLFIDGIEGLRSAMVMPSRIGRFFSALMNELRAMGVTVMFTEETKLFPIEPQTDISDHSAITDNILFLRHAELDSELVRFISVIKARETEASCNIHHFSITPKGIEIGERFKGVEALFTGTPRTKSAKSGNPARAAKRKSGRGK